MSNIAILSKRVKVISIPSGRVVFLFSGQEVLIVQELGDSFTLNVFGNLFYLDGEYAYTIGKDFVLLPSDVFFINLKDRINKKILLEQLRMIYDPEISINIVDLGLVYDVSYSRVNTGNYHVIIQMTLTSPSCGMGVSLIKRVENKLYKFFNIEKIDVILVFYPVWSFDMMVYSAKFKLGLL